MGSCFQCGASVTNNAKFCHQCGYRDTTNDPSAASATVAPKKFVPPPKIVLTQSDAPFTDAISTEKNNNLKKIVVGALALLFFVCGIFFVKNFFSVNYKKNTSEEIPGVVAITQDSPSKITPTIIDNEVVNQGQLAEPADIEPQTNLESKSFPINSYLNAANSQNWDQVNSLLASSALQLPSRGDRKLARNLNDQAIVELKNKNYVGAIELLTKAVAADKSDLEVLNNLGFAQLKSGDSETAKKTYLETLTYNPARSITWGNLAEIFANDNSVDLASAALSLEVYLASDKRKIISTLQKISESDNPEIKESKLTKVISEELIRLSTIPERK